MLHNYLFLSAVIFSIGLYGVLSKKNAITILMCVELMLTSINISAVAFSRYVFNPYYLTDGNLESLLTGQILSMFVIAVAAAEVAIGVAILVAVYQNRQTAYVTDGNKLKY